MFADGADWDSYSPAEFISTWNGNSNNEPFEPFNWPYKPRSDADTIYIFDVGRMIEKGLCPKFTTSAAVIGPVNENIPSDCLVFVAERKTGREKFKREGIPDDIDYYQ